MAENKGAKAIPESKKKVVAEFAKLIKEYPIVGAVNMENLPTKTVQNMRATLRKTVVLKMAKRRLIKLAIAQATKDKPGVEKLIPYLKGMPAMIFTKDNPFTLMKMLQKNKSNAPIKAGQEAPKDIVIPAGPTGFAPGPIIGQLGAHKIKAGIDGGKVVIKEDSLAAKEGDKISEELAGILTRLGIEPMEIGLDLTAVYENGDIFEKKVLIIDEDEYIGKITTGHQWAFNLAMEAGVYNTATTELLVTKAHSDARALAIEKALPVKELIPDVLAKAHNQMLALQSATGGN